MFEAALHPDSLRYVIAGLAALAAIGFFLLDRQAHRRAERAARWPVAPGVVTQSRIARRWGFGSGVWIAGLWYVPDVAYRYEAEGKKYTGSRVFLSDTGFALARRAREVIARYPRGAEIEVRYDPFKPRRACLEPVHREHRALGIAAVLAAVAIAALAAG